MSQFWIVPGAGGGGAVDGYEGLAQTLFVELEEDGYTTANEPICYTTLLSETILTSGGNIVANFSVSFGANSRVFGAIFRLLIDGVLQRATSADIDGTQTTQSASIVYYTTISSGVHTVSVEWCKSTKDSRLIELYSLPATEPNFYHASLLIQEVE